MKEFKMSDICKNCGKTHGEHKAWSDCQGKADSCPSDDVPKTWLKNQYFELKEKLNMKEKEYEALMELIDAKIDEKISSAFGRDTISEFIRFVDLEKEFKTNFIKDN